MDVLIEKMIVEKNEDKVELKNLIKNPQQANQKMSNPDYLVAFSGLAKNYCIGIVDMVSSTKISAEMNEFEWCRYYEIFLNSMAKILPRFGGRVIKNQGDCLLYYFPESSRATQFSLTSCIESALAMKKEHEKINEILKKEKLPKMNYRISLDYGKVVIMNSNNSSTPDLIGPPVNMCAKINHIAETNSIVIGGDLYQNIKHIKDYKYVQKKGFSIGLKYSYPVYQLTR